MGCVLPKEILNLIDTKDIEKIHVGKSKAEVYRTKFNGNIAYLKICESKYQIFRKEVQLLRWLEDKINVPRVLYYKGDLNKQYMILSAIQGKNTLELINKSNKELLVKNLAKGLREIHSIDITNCNIIQTVDVKLREGKNNVDKNIVDIDCSEETSILKINPKNMIEKLNDMKPKNEELVLVHGDYCLPNIMQNYGKISGFIDWSRGGIGDRYQDIGIACRSIRTNFKDNYYVKLFLKEYGLEKYDANKMAYYILLDELF